MVGTEGITVTEGGDTCCHARSGFSAATQLEAGVATFSHSDPLSSYQLTSTSSASDSSSAAAAAASWGHPASGACFGSDLCGGPCRPVPCDEQKCRDQDG